MSIHRAVPVVGPQPCVLHADRNQPAGARSQTKRAVIQDQHRIAFEHVKALLERLHVLIHVALRVELAHAPARVDRAAVAVGQRETAVAGGVARERGRRLDVGGANEVVHEIFGRCIAGMFRRATRIVKPRRPDRLSAFDLAPESSHSCPCSAVASLEPQALRWQNNKTKTRVSLSSTPFRSYLAGFAAVATATVAVLTFTLTKRRGNDPITEPEVSHGNVGAVPSVEVRARPTQAGAPAAGTPGKTAPQAKPTLGSALHPARCAAYVGPGSCPVASC